MLQGAIIGERAFHSDIFLLIEESCWSANQAKSNRYYARNRLPAFGYRARKNLESYKITRIITVLQDVSLMSSWNRQQLSRSVKDQQNKNSTIQERIPFAELSFFQCSNTRSNGRKERKSCNNFEESEYRGQRRRRGEILGVFREEKKNQCSLNSTIKRHAKKHDIERPSKGGSKTWTRNIDDHWNQFFF